MPPLLRLPAFAALKPGFSWFTQAYKHKTFMEEIRKMKGDAVALCSEIKSGFAHIKKVYPISYVHLLITPYIQCFALTSFCVGLKEY